MNNIQNNGVSYIMPVLNEAATLAACVAHIHAQSWSGSYEIILILGPSSDGSTEIAREIAAKNPAIRIRHNPAADIPIALNLAIAAARYDTIVRVDAHSELSPEYTALALQTLSKTGAANVGGIMQAAGKNPVQQAIAAAYNSPFGLGGGVYHDHKAAPKPAESAYLGVFRKSAVISVGGFDETIRRGEDWELNLRLREAGYDVWFNPQLRVTYYPRASLGALAKQFYATGVWRAVLIRRHPDKHPWRFFAPGTLVATLGLSLIAAAAAAAHGFITDSQPTAAIIIGFLPALSYLGAVCVATLALKPKNFRGYLLRAAALTIMHTAWGVGFWRGIIFGGNKIVDTSRLNKSV